MCGTLRKSLMPNNLCTNTSVSGLMKFYDPRIFKWLQLEGKFKTKLPNNCKCYKWIFTHALIAMEICNPPGAVIPT